MSEELGVERIGLEIRKWYRDRDIDTRSKKKTEKMISGKESHISEPVRSAAAEVARLAAAEIQRDEQKQYANGTPCDADGC